jgi:rSAM/selenodomain-associated transferase 2
VPPRSTFSIIIPVLHESKIISSLLDSLEQLERDEPFEIIVVDGSPTLDTLQAIKDKKVKKYACRQGRGRQMNEGAAHATGDVLIFLHADTLLPRNALSLIQTALENQEYIGGAFSLQIKSQTFFFRIIAAITTFRCRMTRAPYGDQVIFLRKSYFDTIGGYKDLPLMEDVELMRRIRKKKGQIVILPETVITSDRRWHQEGFLYTLLRDNGIIFLYWCGWPAEKLAKYYPWLQQ